MKLTTEDRNTLVYLAKQRYLVWGYVYDNGGADDLRRLESAGLIEAVKQAGTQVHHSGGYRITEAGRTALQGEG
jgi:hypothetical protein